MKKYHIADVLSLLEVIAVFAILVCIVLDLKPEIVLLLFGFGEFCDAFDGSAARKWPYPNDGKRRPWRNPTFIKHYEWTKDIALGLSVLAFISIRIDSDLLEGIFCLSVAIILGLALQGFAGWLWIWMHAENQLAERRQEVRRNLERYYVKRRVYLYIPGIVTLVLILLYATSWSLMAKALLIFGLTMVGIFLWDFKEDRRTSENVDELPRPTRFCLLVLSVLMGPSIVNSALAAIDKCEPDNADVGALDNATLTTTDAYTPDSIKNN